jgi:tetratricopeptide (TPR) repeat protein
MRLRVIVSLLIRPLVCPPAYASMGGGHKDEDAPPPQTQNSAPAPALTARQQAEAWYATAYDVVNKGKEELAKGKEKNAMKKFKDAYSRGEQIVEADSMYHEAWNLMGYSARKLGWYDKAFAAYDHCLRIKPDYSPALETRRGVSRTEAARQGARTAREARSAGCAERRRREHVARGDCRVREGNRRRWRLPARTSDHL